MDNLDTIIEKIRSTFTTRNATRDLTLNRSRELIRYCSLTIRAVHREEFDEASKLLATARQAAAAMKADIEQHPALYYTGYTQDSLKELTEACVVFAIVRGEPIPSPDDIEVDEAAYLNGLAEAASELRRRCLDLIRRDRVAEAERMLTAMDDIYAQLVTIDFPDALTGGLRRTTDTLRAVLERTRGDLTTTLQQEKLQKALNEMERRVVG
ncbi:MAG: haloacid dehalogenase [Chloroflexi bacterium]|nr:haloacid dehalogenase [Chloroflexota bacterium]